MKQSILIILGWICVALGILGFILPLMPGTVFLILALFFFAKSSEKFHQMLLDHPWFGNDLKKWQENKCISTTSFKKATTVIILSFTVSIILVHGKTWLQILLLSIAIGIIWYLRSICELADKKRS